MNTNSIIFIPLIVAIIGLLMMIFSKSPSKAIRIGEIMFEVGLLVTLLRLAVVTIGVAGK